MEMTEKQFQGVMMFIRDDLKDVLEETDKEKIKSKLERILENIQYFIED